MRRSRLISCFALAAGGCVTPPQTRAEFVDAVKHGAYGVTRESYTVSRDLGAVVASLEQRSKECLAKNVDRTGMVGGSVEVAGSTYRPTINRVSTDRVEFTLQVEHSPSGTAKVPPGGLFVLAEDLGRDGNATRVDAYVTTIGFDDVVKAIRAWIEGHDGECPALP
jgi:hypothetical protein